MTDSDVVNTTPDKSLRFKIGAGMHDLLGSLQLCQFASVYLQNKYIYHFYQNCANSRFNISFR